jgi:hypothetical protein
MDLDEFVATAIESIYNGLKEAKQTTGKTVIPAGVIVSEGLHHVKEVLIDLYKRDCKELAESLLR